MTMILRAAALAARCHADQKRKHNGAPYITHPIRVAGRASIHPIATDEVVAAAWLHDAPEDYGTTDERWAYVRNEILAYCGKGVWDLVLELTSFSVQTRSKLPRAERQVLNRSKLASISHEGKVLKLLDRIDNVRESILDLDRGLDKDTKFNRLYARESEMMWEECLKGVDNALEGELIECISALRLTCDSIDTRR